MTYSITRRCFLVFALLLTTWPAYGQATSSQTFTGEQLHQRGIYRLGDIGYVLQKGRVASVDGFSNALSLAGLSPMQHRSYRIVIDGHEVDTGFWDVQNITALGIPVTDVDSVRIVEHPVMADGILAPGGLLQVWTKSYDNPVTTSVSTFAGNESGDPGPFRYADDDLIVANVDKIGPDAAGTVTLQRPDLLFSAGASVSQVIPSDEAVFERNRKIFDVATTPEIRMVSPHMRLRWTGGEMVSDARVFASTDRDMIFSRSVAREIPVDIKQFHASWLGTIPASDRYGMRIQTSYRLIDVRNLSSATRIPLDWNESVLKATVTLNDERPNRVFDAVGARFLLGRAGSSISPDPISDQRAASVFGTSAYGVGDYSVVTTITVGRHTNRFVGGILAELHRVYQQHYFGVHSSAMRVSRYDSDPIGLWLGSGLQVSPDIPTRSNFGKTYGLFTADATWRWKHPVHGLLVEVQPSLRYFQDADLLSRTVSPDGDGFVVISNGSQRTDGTLFRTTLRGTLTRSITTIRASADWQRTMQGDKYFYRAFDEMPDARIGIETIVAPVSSFSTVLAATYLSSSNWFDYSMLDDESFAPYSQVVDPSFKVDAGLSKAFWSGRVNLQIMLENLFNDHISYHPIGARFDRTMKFTAHVLLD